MKLFQLERVKFEGKEYRRCTISVDEAVRQAEITHLQKKLFSSSSISLTKFAFDSNTKVSRYGASLNIDGIELVALTLEEASKIESIVGEPNRAAREQAMVSLANAEERARDLLKIRGETFSFLSIIKADPAEGMFQLYVSTGTLPETALKEYLKSRREKASAALEKLDSAIADLGQKAGLRVAERVCAVTYLAGKVQDNLFERGEPGLKVEGFVAELGIAENDLSCPYENVPFNLISAAHKSTAALLD